MKRRGGTRTTSLIVLAVLAVSASACGSRLTGGALHVAEGTNNNGGTGQAPATGDPGVGTGAAGTDAVAGSSATAGTPGAATAGKAGTTPAKATPVAAAGAGSATSAACNTSNNGGATGTGITANTITIGNITSISGVAPGLTQSAQAATEAFAAYVNSTGGICGRQLKVVTYDDQNDASQNAADAAQACSATFALVGSASGFDNGGASTIQSCGIPYVGAELSTQEMGVVPNAFGASPGNAHYWPTGPAVWLKSQYPNAVTHAAMIYLNVPATQEQAASEMKAYQSVGFNYVYTVAVSPTEPNYAPYVAKMQSAGVQYVTEYSDDNSAARLLQAMAQANYQPQVVDWFSEEYGQHFLSEAQGDANGDLVLMATTAVRGPAQPGHGALRVVDEPGGAGLEARHLRRVGVVGRTGLPAGGQGGGHAPHPRHAHPTAAADRRLERRRGATARHQLRPEDPEQVLRLRQGPGQRVRRASTRRRPTPSTARRARCTSTEARPMTSPRRTCTNS